MTAVDVLNQLVAEMRDAVAKGNQYPSASTSNQGVVFILNEAIMQVQKAIIEIHKGNVK